MKTLITGGAGFIGVNLAIRLLEQGRDVVVLDNLSRPGSEKNLDWLQRHYPGKFVFQKADIRDYPAMVEAVKGAGAVYHLAAQVAVTSSVLDPVTDFEINARGLLNVLEAVRKESPAAFFLFSSTNKVYGGLEQARVDCRDDRYVLPDFPEGIGEKEPLDFCSPYGCSKGAADQYVRDYSRIYGLKTVVFRQSCIYGQHQHGNEDQGWVAFLMLCALQNRRITVYGDGKQVRDILFADDLVSAFELAGRNIDASGGQIYNIGGGKGNTLSLLELLAWLERKLQRKVDYGFSGWRPGDQKVYVSDIRKAAAELNWTPRTSREEGLQRLFDWLNRKSEQR